MFLLKVIGKIILIPVIAIVILIEWVGIFLNSLSCVVTGILSFLFVLTGTASLLFGLASGPEFLRMMAIAFVIFLIPYVGNWFIERIAALRYFLGDYLRS